MRQAVALGGVAEADARHHVVQQRASPGREVAADVEQRTRRAVVLAAPAGHRTVDLGIDPRATGRRAGGFGDLRDLRLALRDRIGDADQQHLQPRPRIGRLRRGRRVGAGDHQVGMKRDHLLGGTRYGVEASRHRERDRGGGRLLRIMTDRGDARGRQDADQDRIDARIGRDDPPLSNRHDAGRLCTAPQQQREEDRHARHFRRNRTPP